MQCYSIRLRSTAKIWQPSWWRIRLLTASLKKESGEYKQVYISLPAEAPQECVVGGGGVLGVLLMCFLKSPSLLSLYTASLLSRLWSGIWGYWWNVEGEGWGHFPGVFFLSPPPPHPFRCWSLWSRESVKGEDGVTQPSYKVKAAQKMPMGRREDVHGGVVSCLAGLKIGGRTVASGELKLTRATKS